MLLFNKCRIARLLAKIPLSSRYFGPPRLYGENIDSLTKLEYQQVEILQPERKVVQKFPVSPDYPDIAERIQKEHAEIKESQKLLYLLPDARVLGADNAHGVISNADRFILYQYDSYGQQIENHPVYYTLKFPKLKKIAGVSFSLISLWSDNYWHWLFDVIGKLMLINNIRSSKIPKIDYLLVLNLDDYKFKREILIALGYRPDQLINVKKNSHFECEQLLIADCCSANLDADLISAIRAAFLKGKENQGSGKRIYISRRNSSRRIINENELESELKKLGIDTILLENLSFFEQVELFHGASVVFAQHGAGLTNIVFSNPGTIIIELFEPDFISPCFGFLSNKLSLEYHMLINDYSKKTCIALRWENQREIYVNAKDLSQKIVHLLNDRNE